MILCDWHDTRTPHLPRSTAALSIFLWIPGSSGPCYDDLSFRQGAVRSIDRSPHGAVCQGRGAFLHPLESSYSYSCPESDPICSPLAHTLSSGALPCFDAGICSHPIMLSPSSGNPVIYTQVAALRLASARERGELEKESGFVQALQRTRAEPGYTDLIWDVTQEDNTILVLIMSRRRIFER